MGTPAVEARTMIHLEGDGVAVLIAAHNAAATIGAAVRSALSQRETSEVVVVDDASTDGTDEAALLSARGDPRLRVLTSERNLGPAGARNVAIAASSAPVIAVLDADDAFLPGRLSRLLAKPGWDMIADNIAFISPDTDETLIHSSDTDDGGLSALDLAGFVRGNVPRSGQSRGELGFLKPLIRRRFLDQGNLRYNAELRLGEDYDLYVRALMRGARFLVEHRVGYVAHVRSDSLSGQHSTEDLARLTRVAQAHLDALPTEHGAAPSLARLRDNLRARHLHRACLDEKARGGIGAALSHALTPPTNVVPIARGVVRDKIAALRPARARGTDQPRVLIPAPPGLEDARTAAKPSRA